MKILLAVDVQPEFNNDDKEEKKGEKKEENVDYAFDEEFGYLTACPTNAGTGLRASVMMHLPGLVLTKNISSVISQVNNLGIEVRGLYGEGTEADGNLYQLSNITIEKYLYLFPLLLLLFLPLSRLRRQLPRRGRLCWKPPSGEVARTACRWGCTDSRTHTNAATATH